VPFLTRLLGDDSNVAPEHLSAAIIGARIEFSRVGINDPGDVIKTAERKLYDMTFSPLRELLEYGKEFRVNFYVLGTTVFFQSIPHEAIEQYCFTVLQPLWSKIKNAQDCVKQFAIVDADDLLPKADDKFMELARGEIEEAKSKRDLSGLKE